MGALSAAGGCSPEPDRPPPLADAGTATPTGSDETPECEPPPAIDSAGSCGEETIQLRADTIRAAKGSGPKVKMLVSDEDAPLLSALKAKRRALAEAAGVPAYIIFNDKTLIEMAETRPATLDQMARIGGVGAKKLEHYGMAFLEVIAGEAEALHPRRRKLAGKEAGSVYDQLLEAQNGLARGEDGTGKPMSCNASVLARLAEAHPADLGGIERIIGARHAERFGPAFLEILQGG